MPKPHRIVQFRYGKDNLGYLLHGKAGAIAVDGGAVDEMLAFLNENELELLMVTNTHSHGDHTCGNKALVEATGAVLIPVSELPEMRELVLEKQRIRILHTPGHTDDSVCFSYRNILLTGDTLFNGKVGRCFTGDLESFFNSVKKILGFSDNTFIYAGHDYYLEYLDTAWKLEPENRLLEICRDGYDSEKTLVSTLGWEKKVDPFIRFNRPSLIRMMNEKGLPTGTEFERFCSMLNFM
ncbi:hydroxyacylglutathione hydrolase [Candidatus Fermentibacteria bacterium]|nr:MAG: hydroxyacylglutathione hydrolase [Candidatus Fermentibacteria bacterium]